MTSTTDAELTDRFLLGQMSSQEENQFRLRLDQDPELNLYVEQTATIIQGLQYMDERERLLLKLQMVEDQLLKEAYPRSNAGAAEMSTRAKHSGPSRKVMAIAASLALLLIASFWAIGKFNTQRSITMDYFQPIPKEMVLLMDQLDGAGFALPDEAHRKSLLRALEHYERRDFDAAELALKRHLEEQTGDLNAKLFLGLTFLAQTKADLAVAMLLPVAQSHDYALRDCARWYLVLSMIESGEPGTSIRKHLTILASNPGGPYYEKAVDLMKRLK